MTKPSPENCENCSSKCAYDCAQLQYITQHRTVLIISPLTFRRPVWGPGTPLPPCPFTSSSFTPFYFSLSFIGFAYFLLLSIPSLSTRIVPLRFQAGSRRRRPNLGLVCVLLCNLCYLYSLVKMDCGACSIWFSLVMCVPSVPRHCWLGYLIRKNLSPMRPIMCLVGR